MWSLISVCVYFVMAINYSDIIYVEVVARVGFLVHQKRYLLFAPTVRLWGHCALRDNYEGELHAPPSQSRFLVTSCRSSGPSTFLIKARFDDFSSSHCHTWRSMIFSQNGFRLQLRPQLGTDVDGVWFDSAWNITRSKCFGAKGACQAQRPGPQRIGVGRAGGLQDDTGPCSQQRTASMRPGLIVWPMKSESIAWMK